MTNKEANNKKRNIIIIGILLLLLLCVTLGSAYLTQMLQINGTTNIAKSSWDIHFANEAEQEGSVMAREPLTIDTSKTLITFGVTFTKPGEYYEFEVDTVNDGAMDAMVNRVTKVGISEENAKYISFETTYSDGAPIKQYDLLAQKTSERIKVRVEFKEVDSALDLPSSNLDLNLELEIEYTQSDENAQEREEVKKEPAIIKAGALSFPDLDNKQVKKIILDNRINIPENAIATADFSAEQDSRVIAYIVENTEDTTMYNLHIEGDGSLYANSNSSSMFANFTNVEQIIGGEKLNTSLIVDMSNMFVSLSKLTTLNISTWDLSNVTNMMQTFAMCKKLIALDGTNWGLEKVETMMVTFVDCYALTTLGDTSNWSLANLTNMYDTFGNCKTLTSLKTTNWNTAKVENFYNLFYGADNLMDIDISVFDFTSATNVSRMFSEANKISGTINMNGTNITGTAGMFVFYNPTNGETITINYTPETESIVDAMLANEAKDCLIKGTLIEG